MTTDRYNLFDVLTAAAKAIGEPRDRVRACLYQPRTAKRSPARTATRLITTYLLIECSLCTQADVCRFIGVDHPVVITRLKNARLKFTDQMLADLVERCDQILDGDRPDGPVPHWKPYEPPRPARPEPGLSPRPSARHFAEAKTARRAALKAGLLRPIRTLDETADIIAARTGRRLTKEAVRHIEIRTLAVLHERLEPLLSEMEVA